MVIVAKSSKGGNIDYEKVAIDDWLTGEIVEVQEKKGVKKQFKDDETGEIKTREIDQCRFVFTIDEYKYKHRSRWMTISTNKNSNLYKKYIVSLFGNKFPPDSTLDIERLIGLKVKTMWDNSEYVDKMTGEEKVFQFVAKIRLLNPDDAEKIDLLIPDLETEEKEMQEAMDNVPEETPEEETETPF